MRRVDKVILSGNTFPMRHSTLTQKGQVTVPKRVRDAFGWTQETELTFIKYSDGVKIVEAGKFPEIVLEQMKETRWTGPSADELLGETRSEI